MLPVGDHTPQGYALPEPTFSERLKRPFRRVLYPALNALLHPFLSARYSDQSFRPDLWLWGQRGNDYERQRRRVNGFLPIKGTTILIAGCGTGRDVESWVAMNPAQVLAVDWFRYDRAWDLWQSRFQKNAASTSVEFVQADLSRLTSIADESVDVIGSDAVFEHLRDLPGVLSEFHRVLKPNGVLYATFGPLWYGWGGDHVSGYDHVNAGFNHLILSRDMWLRYVDANGTQEHSEHDGRTWIEHDLFSRLKPDQYLSCMKAAGFDVRFHSAIIDPRAVQALQGQPTLRKELLQQNALRDLLVCGMTIIATRR